MSTTKGAFQPWSWRKVIKGFSTFKSKLFVTKGLFNMKEPFATKGLFNLYLNEGIVCDQRGFSTSILTEGNQGAFQPWNQTCSWQRGISTSILSRELSATKGLFIFDLYEGIVCDHGASNLDPDEGTVYDQRAFQPWSWQRNFLDERTIYD